MRHSNKKSLAGHKAFSMNFANTENTVRRRKKQLSFEEVKAAAKPALRAIVERWLPGGRCEGHEYVALNPTRSDQKLGSFKVNLNSGQWCDFATGDKGGDIISLAAYLRGISRKDALYKVADMLGVRHD